jgi:carboxypeptidase family protein
MLPDVTIRRLFAAQLAILMLLTLHANLPATARAQSTAALQGRVVDPHGAVVPGTKVAAHNAATGAVRVAVTDGEGFYQLAALPVGSYRLVVHAAGFRTAVVERLDIEVTRTAAQNFRLEVGDINQTVNVSSDASLIERTTISVGQIIDERTMQELPLNGRRFIDLGLLVPGSVTPPQNGFLSAPTRGLGSAALNTAGNREETGNYQINGVTLNDQINNTISFLPPIGSIREFKFDNSTFSAEYGRNSGSVINIATRQGSNEFHGELFEFFRHDALDARNFFNFTSSEPPPFRRNEFGGAVGGPVVLPRFGEGGPASAYHGRNRTFFFFSYEGLRQRQGVDLNSRVLSDQQRAAVSDPVIRRLVELLPRANFTDSSGVPRFIGATAADVTVDQWTIDISHSLDGGDLLHGYYAFQRDDRNEPTLQGNTVPGFGDRRPGRRQIFTLNWTHIFDPVMVNEARLGFSRNHLVVAAGAPLNPADFGIRNGVNRPAGLPLVNVAGELNFGGPALLNGRGDTSLVVSDTLSLLRGRHTVKLGGEYRRFYSNFFVNDPGRFNFPSVAAFIEGRANAFSITLGDQSGSISQGALDLFAQESFKLRSNLTIELGLRYAWHMTPTERFDRFVVFDPATVSLVRVGTDVDRVYKTNAKNFQPRLGLAWDPFGDGRTSVRTAYALLTEQPLTNAVQSTVANPPFATPLAVTGTVRLDDAIDLAGSAGIAPVTVDRAYDNSYVQSWNLSVQREVMRDLAVMVGYFGSKGTHLRISRNINQPVGGARPFTRLSASSPILPGAALGNVTQVEGTGNSSYNALWATALRRLRRGLHLNASYTWSKSIDYNSLSSPPAVVTVQNSYDLRGDRGVSDFDARHRLVVSAIYELPFEGNLIKEGWQLACIVQSQSGNPLNIITANSTVNGVANTLRPDVAGPVEIVGSLDRWFDTGRFVQVARFGNLGRNVVTGPGFNNVDFSVLKNVALGEERRLQFRAEAFDLFNHANFGQPGRVAGSAAFGRIVNTRFPTGDSGSSRQLQFAVKFIF